MISEIQSHTAYDPKTLRIMLSKEELEALPFKQVTKDELYELKGNDDYNPTVYYSEKVELQANEVGHDLVNRYCTYV